MKDFYYILGVDANCTLDEIREAYRKLSKKFHPDMNRGDEYFEARFREINEAYETLSDQVRRHRYDDTLVKFKSDITEEENTKEQQYQQAENKKYKHKHTVHSNSKSRGPGVGMSIVLILVVLILGVYIVKLFTSSKKNKVKAVIVNPVSPKSYKHHKKKHSLKSAVSNSRYAPKSDLDSIHRAKNQPLTNNNKPHATDNTKQPVLNINKPLVPPVDKTTDHEEDFLYATYVHANVTGVINMRATDDYNSAVIEKIPANSRVFVIKKGDMYYKVSFNSHTGYIPRWSLQQK